MLSVLREKEGAALGHDCISTVVEATKLTPGYTKHDCSRCGFSYTDSYVDYIPVPEQVFVDMYSLRSAYPEGMSWTNNNFYAWNGGIYSGGYGCAGFAFRLSDEAFGYLPARMHENFEDIKVGDILRVNGDTHSVIVLEIRQNGVVIAEGNYNYSIHWGRVLSYDTIKRTGTYVMTRYPE